VLMPLTLVAAGGPFAGGGRPHAELELVVTLGAVIGAHAGPGTLALFWFRDDVSSR